MDTHTWFGRLKGKKGVGMIVISLTMLLIVAAAVLVVTYFAYPQRGRPVPRLPRLGPALTRAADRIGMHERESERPPSRL